ncbi:MAG: AmmeMemoRadiSam system radical SAM enzyme [Eubacteriales bacterium]
MKEAHYYKNYKTQDDENDIVQCELCPHFCLIHEGKRGICHARLNEKGVLYAESFGQITSIALDPIEKKPLMLFNPGHFILSVGSYGCNFKCSFCQNHSISMAGKDDQRTSFISPDELISKAIDMIPNWNIGVAFTYNEPLISYEYVSECSKLAHQKKLKTVLVTNGFINEKPLLELLPFIDAMNIDLKSFSPSFYKKIGGLIEPVKRTIEISAKACHVEITTLIIPGENDSPDEMDALSSWIASIDSNIPLHISRFFPRYKMTGKPSTPEDTIYLLSEIARKHLIHVYEGNL